MENTTSSKQRTSDLTPVYSGPYIRESLSDNGSLPYTGASNMSPDIIPRQNVVNDPNITLGTQAEWTQDLGDNIEAGSQMYIYVRAANAGSSVANVNVHLYYAKNATFNPRSTWIKITPSGGVPLTIPAKSGSDDGIGVTTPITWTVPVANKNIHQCLIAYITDSNISAPPATFSNGDFLKYTKDHNSIAFRNLTIVDVDTNNSIEFTQDVINDTTNPESRTYIIKCNTPVGTIINITSSAGLNINESYTTTNQIQNFVVSGEVQNGSVPPLTAVLTVSAQLPNGTHNDWSVSITEQTTKPNTDTVNGQEETIELGAYHYCSSGDILNDLSRNGYKEETNKS